MLLGYCRCSTDEQAKGTTLEEQERIIRGIAMTRGIDDIRIYRDPGVSGATPIEQRPEGGKLLALMKKGDIVCAAKLDRMFRSASDALLTAEKMKAAGVDLILFDVGADAVTQNGMAKCFFTMASAFAELERSRISERMADGRAAKKRKAGHIGGYAPYGFRKRGSGREAILVPDCDEQTLVQLARKLAADRSPMQVTREINKRGYRTRAGTFFQLTQVQRMLVDKQYGVAQ